MLQRFRSLGIVLNKTTGDPLNICTSTIFRYLKWLLVFESVLVPILCSVDQAGGKEPLRGVKMDQIGEKTRVESGTQPEKRQLHCMYIYITSLPSLSVINLKLVFAT